MRIVFITPEFVTEEYFSGGLANYVHRVSKSLCSMGHEIHVFVKTTKDQETFLFQGILVHRIHIPQRKPWLTKIIRRFFYNVNSMLLFSIKAWLHLEKLQLEHPIDIVQSSNHHACGLFCTFFFKKAPVVTRMSTYTKACNKALNNKMGLNLFLTEFIEIIQLKKSKYIYAPSHLVANMIQEKERIGNIKVIRSPIYFDLAETDNYLYKRYLKNKKYLLFVGRYQLYKGIHVLGQALPEVFANIPELEAVFIGKEVPTKEYPSMRGYIQNLCQSHKEKLHFFDQMHHKMLYPIIQNAHLVILPSLIDNFPNTLLESMMLGKVVIGTWGASFDEVIEDGKNGFLVEPDNPNKLAKKIIEAWHCPNLLDMGMKAKEKSNDYEPESSVNSLLRYYSEIIIKHNNHEKYK